MRCVSVCCVLCAVCAVCAVYVCAVCGVERFVWTVVCGGCVISAIEDSAERLLDPRARIPRHNRTLLPASTAKVSGTGAA